MKPLAVFMIAFVSSMVLGSSGVLTANAATNQFVQTPVGLLPAACVFDVGNNAMVFSNGTVVLSNGVRETNTCSKSAQAQYSPPQSSWVEYAGYTDPSLPTSYTGTWVPNSSPTSNNGQVIYLFTSLIDPYGDIIQPVLQWGYNGAFGGAYWTIASWYCAGITCNHSTPITVSVNDVIQGTITGYGCNSTGCPFSITTTDSSISQSTTLNVRTCGACTEATVTLEAYSINSCSDFPSSGYTHFSQLSMSNSNGPVSISWSNYIVTNYGCSQSVSSGTVTNVYLDY
jgi:hypothetical protein